MAPVPGIATVLIANALLLLVATAGLLYLNRRIEFGDDPEEWYEEARSLVRDVERVASTDGPVDRDRIQGELVPLSTRLKSHARSAPSTADERLVRDLHELGVECYRIGMEHTPGRAAREGVFVEDRLEDLRTDAKSLAEAIASRR